MDIIYGTRNLAKLASMQKCLDGLKQRHGLNIIGLGRYGDILPDIEENGGDPLENARIKAFAYYKHINKPLFSLDSGLYFDGLPEHLQPGLDVRRVNGKRLNDDEMIAYYSQLSKDYGGRLIGRYINGICLILDKDTVFEHMGEDIASEKFMLTPEPHKKRVEGFPLDSLSVHIKSSQYYYDLYEARANTEDDLADFDKEWAWQTDSGFKGFFSSVIEALGK